MARVSRVRGYVEEMKKKGVLRKIDEAIFLKQGVVFIACADSNRFWDWYCHMVSLVDNPKLVHTISDNGGALQIVLDPVRRIKILQSAEKALIAKGFRKVVILSHLFCLIAKEESIIPDKAIGMTVEAAAIALDYFNLNPLLKGKVEVFPHYHIDYGDDLALANGEKLMETYSVNEFSEYNLELPELSDQKGCIAFTNP